MREMLHIGEVAELLGVTHKTIRYYQEIGLVSEPERSEGGYRLYGADDLLNLRRIRQLRSLGLPVEQVREVLEDPEGEALSTALRAQLEEISAQILELEERREMVNAALVLGDVDFSEDLAERNTPEPERKFWNLIRTLRWPKAYREFFAGIKREKETFAELYPEQARLGEEMFRRFDALAELPEDAPEVESLADDYFSKYLGEIQPDQEEKLDYYLKSFESSGPIAKILGDLALRSFSPAQRRFIKLLQTQGEKTSA